jgi:hypothetical protein
MLLENYKKCEYFHGVYKELEGIYNADYSNLLDINLRIIYFLKDLFLIKTPIYLSSQLDLDKNLKSTEKLVEICRKYNASKYLSGKDGPNYMNMELFQKENIEVIVQDYLPQQYKQQFGEFMPYITALDSYLNIGKLL